MLTDFFLYWAKGNQNGSNQYFFCKEYFFLLLKTFGLNCLCGNVTFIAFPFTAALCLTGSNHQPPAPFQNIYLYLSLSFSLAVTHSLWLSLPLSLTLSLSFAFSLSFTLSSPPRHSVLFTPSCSKALSWHQLLHTGSPTHFLSSHFLYTLTHTCIWFFTFISFSCNYLSKTRDLFHREYCHYGL